MKKYSDFIREDLNGPLVEPQSDASAQAAQLGLVYVGFGRYENPQTQQITHIVQNGQLIPYAKAIKSNTFKQTSGNDLGDYTANMAPDLAPVVDTLVKHYGDIDYSSAELAAIQQYSTNHLAINNRLWQMPAGVPGDQIQPAYDGDTLPQTIADLDAAMAKSQTPTDILVYAALPSNFDVTSVQQGSTMTFKGYRSTSLDPSVAVNSAGQNQSVGQFDLRRKTVMLQIKVPRGFSGMYIDDYSSTPGESEFVLPRASGVMITSIPKKLVAGNAAIARDDEIQFFEAQLLSN